MQPQVKQRNSNLELYRIIVMLLIVAHHYVVNSGLMEEIAKELHMQIVIQCNYSVNAVLCA